jgi:2-hydroxy-3-oxopropionate reductase
VAVSDAGAVGFVGLGQMGAPMATRLVGWPTGLRVFDLRNDAVRPRLDAGATAARSAADVGAVAGVVSVMVLDDDQVRAVVDELLAQPRPGQVIAVHSTIRPATAEELAARATAVGVELVDAPVSGGPAGASAGTLAVMVGGDRGAFERVEPVFGRWASLAVHMGPPGAGTRAKLARNLVQFVSYTAAGEAMCLAEAAGLDLRKLGAVVRHSDQTIGGPGAVMVRETAARLASDDWLHDVFSRTRRLGEKDLDLALELADLLGVDLPLARRARLDLGAALGVPAGEGGTGAVAPVGADETPERP